MNEDLMSAICIELKKISGALERVAGPELIMPDWQSADCFVWSPVQLRLEPVTKPNRVPLELIRGVDHVRDILHNNTMQFAKGFSANNVLLWGARGMGKSSLVKAVHQAVRQQIGVSLKLLEVHREDIATLPVLLDLLKSADHRIIVFCDDLSFDHDDTAYKSLKAVLDGGLEGRPDNVIFYATSNRRHLLPRHMMENEQSTAINPSEATEEKVSLSDRFGLWLGFHKCSQEDYLHMVDSYAHYFKLAISREELHAQALEWATTRGARSGRVAWQYIQDLAGRIQASLPAQS